MATEGKVYLSGENIGEIYELLEGGFEDGDEVFNKELESATAMEENVEGKKVYMSEICGKECVSLTGFTWHETLKHTQENTSKTTENTEKTV